MLAVHVTTGLFGGKKERAEGEGGWGGGADMGERHFESITEKLKSFVIIILFVRRLLDEVV